MLFKRKVSVNEYCTTRFDLLFSAEQAERWLEIKRSSPDPVIAAIGAEFYLKHLRAVHFLLLSMAVRERYAWESDIMMGLDVCSRRYLESHKSTYEGNLAELYYQRYRRSNTLPKNRLFETAEFMLDCLCDEKCSQESVLALQEQLDSACASFRADFREIKLIP
ncbi:MAG: hypothetical protein HZB43_10020 [candidate division Zixibacteria bacterium]|nr:hypothetical protein [candidate division Zixibacteria bacterium]